MSTNGVANEKETESDLAQPTISEELLAEDPSLLGGDDVAELLQRLLSADIMAKGMEDKLDGVLRNLDELLEHLGAEETSEDVDSTSASDTTQTLQP